MKNDPDRVILGIVLGGLIGGAALYLLKSSDKEKDEVAKAFEWASIGIQRWKKFKKRK